MKSRVILSNQLFNFIRTCAKTAHEDKITVYAAQASFFVITSAIPFLSLLLSLAGIFLPQSAVFEQVMSYLPSVTKELLGAPNVSLLSISAVTTLWTASRGISAIRAGIENVYHAAGMDGFLKRRIRSIFSTVFFILIIVAAAAVMLFGDFIIKIIPSDFSGLFHSLRTPFFIIIMTAVFTAVYVSVAQRSHVIRHEILPHLPGAVLSSSGWVIFSLIYSFYIDHFPRASAVYGSLAAVCLIMLWLYFCMVILLFGAVINKLRFASAEKSAVRHESGINKRRS